MQLHDYASERLCIGMIMHRNGYATEYKEGKEHRKRQEQKRTEEWGRAVEDRRTDSRGPEGKGGESYSDGTFWKEANVYFSLVSLVKTSFEYGKGSNLEPRTRERPVFRRLGLRIPG